MEAKTAVGRAGLQACLSKQTKTKNMILYGGIPGHIFQAAAGIPDLCACIEKLLDKMIQCEIDDELHLESAICRAMMWFGELARKLPQSCPSLLLQSVTAQSSLLASAINNPADLALVKRAVQQHCSEKQ